MEQTEDRKILSKICVISPIPGTIRSFYSGLIRKLVMVFSEVFILSSDEPGLYDFKDRYGCNIVPVDITRRMSPWKDIVSICKIFRWLHHEKCDIVHVHTSKGAFIGIVASYLAGVPNRIYTMHGLFFDSFTGLKRKVLWFVEWLTCRLATTIIVVSYSVKRRAVEEKVCAEDKMQIFGDGSACGIDLERFNPEGNFLSFRKPMRQRLSIPEKAIVFGFVGRIVPSKGIEALVEAFEYVSKQLNDTYLLLVGNFENLCEVIDEDTRSRIDNNVKIICGGYADDVLPFYSAMDVVVLPSRREGFPYVPLEAAAMELPVIASRVTGCIDAVVDNVTGLLIEYNDIAQLSQAMLKLAREPLMRRRFGQQGRERIVKFFNSDRLIAEHILLYKKILGM